jgi:GDPmannose 4,6-dehydratase
MKALITGITGQDGSYLAELLLEKGYKVCGLIRRTSQDNFHNIKHLEKDVEFCYGDMTDSGSINNIIEKSMPDEIYNFAAMSQVRISYDVPVSTFNINTLGFLRIIEAVRRLNPKIKIYQASSSEMFGKVQQIPQTEITPFYPRSPYGVSKTAAFYIGRSYREGYGMKIYNGILFNHESPRRGDNFLSKKVVKAAVRIKRGLQDKLILGNLDSKRDWGYAKEYVEWIYRIMQGQPDDYIICTGETHSVQEWVELSFELLGLDWRQYVEFDEDLKRPAEVDILLGDYSKSERILGFVPKVKFKDLVKIMIDYELALGQ